MRQFGIVLCLASLPALTYGCSLQMCRGDGPEIASSFSLRMVWETKTVPGVTVQISSGGETIRSVWADAGGIVRVQHLPAGRYWLSASVHSHVVASYCFHVRSRSGCRAKRNLRHEIFTYERWSNPVAGGFLNEEGDRSIQALISGVRPSISALPNVQLLLVNLMTNHRVAFVADKDGHFHAPVLDNGLYLLDVRPAAGGLDFEGYETTVQVLSHLPYPASDLVLTRRERSGTECGSGPALYLTRSGREAATGTKSERR